MKTSKIIKLLDFTRLKEEDSLQDVLEFCAKSQALETPVACVCIYPEFVKAVREQLPELKVATVANFPEGTDSIEQVATQIQASLDAGAHEIDVVMPYTQLIEGNYKYVTDFLTRCRDVTHDRALLKVIIESGALDEKQIIKATAICSNANIDFIKTSTGKISDGASPKAVNTILKVLEKLDSPMGIKISGGVRTPEQAIAYIDIISIYKDERWVTPAHVRLGASQLLDALVEAGAGETKNKAP